MCALLLQWVTHDSRRAHSYLIHSSRLTMAQLRMPNVGTEGSPTIAGSDPADKLCWDALAKVPATLAHVKLVEQEYRGILRAMLVKHTCRLCAATYTLWGTIGLGACKTHPGRWDQGSRCWSCCGATHMDPQAATYESMFAFGCVPADHLSTVYDSVSGFGTRHTVEVPLPIVTIMPHLDKRWIVGFRKNYHANPNIDPRDVPTPDTALEIGIGDAFAASRFVVGGVDMGNYTARFARIHGGLVHKSSHVVA